MLIDSAPISSAHIAGDGFDFGTAVFEPLPKALQCLLAPAWPNPKDAALIKVDNQGDIFGFLAQIVFINGNALDLRQRHVGIAFRQIGLHDAFDRIPTHMSEARNIA